MRLPKKTTGSTLLTLSLLVCANALVTSTTLASEDGVQPSDEKVQEQLGEQIAEQSMPVAPNVDLAAPQPDDEELPPPAPDKAPKPAPTGESFVLLGTEIPPATSTRLSWGEEGAFEGISGSTPVLVANGAEAGPVMCVTAAVHGDELNGIEMVRELLYDIDPNKLTGTVIGVPIVNLDGFRRNSRYLSDRRDLNRYFPGNPNGSSASRTAYEFFNQIILNCEVLVDLHTGSFRRTNLPQLRANLKNEDVVELAEGFGDMVILHSSGSKGTLRRAATEYGIPSVTLEAGGPMRLQRNAVASGVKGIQNLMSHMDMYGKRNRRFVREPHYYKSKWIRADQGGILFSKVDLGERVKPGSVLGTITDPITNVRAEVTSPYKGRVLGMALDQVLMPGFAAFRIGIQTSEEEVQKAIPAPKAIKQVSISQPRLDASQRARIGGAVLDGAVLGEELVPVPLEDEPVAEEE